MRRTAMNYVATGLTMMLAACGPTGALPPSGTPLSTESATVAPTATSGGAATPVGDAAVEPSSAWSFGDETTTEVGDVNLEFSGGYEFAGNAATFDGHTGFAASSQPAPMTTTDSFTVSAWASLADLPEFAYVASQLGIEAAAFFLGVSESTWDFAMKDADTNEPGHTIRASSHPSLVDIGRWTHLTGVHDAAAGEIRLYIDGVLAKRTAFDRPWQAEGPLTIGRSQAHSVPDNYWPGSVASVAIYADALTSEQIRGIYEATRPTGAPPALSAGAQTDAAFRLARDAICRAGSADIANINDTVIDRPDATRAEIAAGLRQVSDRVVQAQHELDALAIPIEFADFVAADNARRAERVRLVHELAAAIEAGDDARADEVDRDLTALNVETEAAEYANRLAECP